MKKLDFGCGNGSDSEFDYNNCCKYNWLKLHGDKDTIALDINEERIAQAKQRIHNSAKFIVADGRHTDFNNGEFNLIHVNGVLHHIPNYKDVLKEIARITSRTGWLHITESVDNDPIFRLGRRLISTWHGDEVASKFTSSQLIKEIERYYVVRETRYYWRAPFALILENWNKEPKISLKLHKTINTALNRMKISKYTCCHLVIKAQRF